ncbi:MAG: hypothetical protein ACE144_14340 [Thermodesulfobacteriota bacterium]
MDENLLDDNLLIEGIDDTEDPLELGEGDKDFLKGLQKKAEEVADEPDSID